MSGTNLYFPIHLHGMYRDSCACNFIYIYLFVLNDINFYEGLHVFVQAHSPSLDNYRNEKCFNKNCRQQDKRSTINVTLSYVRATIIEGENQYYTF